MEISITKPLLDEMKALSMGDYPIRGVLFGVERNLPIEFTVFRVGERKSSFAGREVYADISRIVDLPDFTGNLMESPDKLTPGGLYPVVWVFHDESREEFMLYVGNGKFNIVGCGEDEISIDECSWIGQQILFPKVY